MRCVSVKFVLACLKFAGVVWILCETTGGEKEHIHELGWGNDSLQSERSRAFSMSLLFDCSCYF